MDKVIENNMTWQEFYKFPLMLDEYGGNVIAQPGEMGYRWAFDWIENEFVSEYPVKGERGYEFAKDIVDILNGKKYNDMFFHNWEADKNDPCVITMNGKPCMCIRGYGELTGTGGLHLPGKVADKIQDDFRDYIIKTLSKA